MSDRRPEEPVPGPTPRDMPDQQAGTGADPWEAAGNGAQPTDGEQPEPDPEIPDTDEAGTGRRGTTPHSGSPSPEHPVPDEPSG
ncbi:hypothetical protein ACIHCV_41280 [Streptomyces sp. NPDC051956]|uniref:hypothetical protein n=1 Tax=Streptomyces sp. NPDC051956 TaxID=3365677 RepID=UPI0037D8A0A2